MSTTRVASSSSPSIFSLFLLFALFSCPSAAAIAHLKKSSCSASRFSPRLVPTKEEAQLKVLVPNIVAGSLRQFVDCSDPSRVRGFCIDVFEKALSILDPPSLSSTPIHYTCFNFSQKSNSSNVTLTYSDMVGGVANGTYDDVVGDVTINSQRAFDIDLTSKYMQSGVVIIGKVVQNRVDYNWKFFGLPFTWNMWCTIVGAFAFTGFLLWLLEHENHEEFIEGSFPRRGYAIFWFVMETLILMQRERIKSTSAQVVMVAWVFVVLLWSSSYTAGLSSILTANNLSPTSYDLSSLKDTNKSIAIRRGSIVKQYLIERFHFQEKQLKEIRTTVDFVNNLTKGEVIAIIDERPYANLMLQSFRIDHCQYNLVGQALTNEGFAFGFKKDLNWSKFFSIALMKLTESGCLQELQKPQHMDGNIEDCSPNSQKITWQNCFPLILLLVIISYSLVIKSIISQAMCKSLPKLADQSILQLDGERLSGSQYYNIEVSNLQIP